MAKTFPLAVVISAVDKITAPMRKVTGSIGRLGSQISSVGKGLTAGVTAPLVGLAAWSVKAGVDFDRSFRRIGSVTGATAEEMRAMEQAVRALPPDLGMRRGIEVLEGLAEEGFNAADALEAMEATALLAKAANLESAEAASVMADTLAAVGGEAKDAAELADLLTKSTGGSSKMMKEFAQVLQVAGPGFKASGLALRDQIAAVKGFAAANFEGSLGATAMRAAMTRLQKPSRDAIETFGRLKINREDLFTAQGDLRSLAEILGTLRTRGAQTSDFLRIFGQDAGAAFAAVDPANIAAARAELDQVGGETARRAAQNSQGAAAAFERLGNVLDQLRDTIASSGLLDFVSDIVQVTVELVQWLSKASPGVLKFGLIFAGIAAVSGPVLIALGSVMTVIGGIGTAIGVITPIVTGFFALLSGAFATLGATIMATPIGWILAGIALLIGAGYLLWKHWDKVTKFVKTAWIVAMTPVRMGVEWLMEKLPTLGDLLPDWLKNLIGIPTTIEAKGGPSDAVAAVSAGGRVESVTKGEASVKVEIANLPPGSRVTQQRNDGVDLDLLSGYALGT